MVECLIIVDARLLRIATIDPSAGDQIGTGGIRDEAPCVICQKSLEFILHGSPPIVTKKSFTIRLWHEPDQHMMGGGASRHLLWSDRMVPRSGTGGWHTYCL